MIELTDRERVALADMLRSCLASYIRKNKNLSLATICDLTHAYDKVYHDIETHALDEITKEFFGK